MRLFLSLIFIDLTVISFCFIYCMYFYDVRMMHLLINEIGQLGNFTLYRVVKSYFHGKLFDVFTSFSITLKRLEVRIISIILTLHVVVFFYTHKYYRSARNTRCEGIKYLSPPPLQTKPLGQMGPYLSERPLKGIY